jgi:lactoylglutathione lyase
MKKLLSLIVLITGSVAAQAQQHYARFNHVGLYVSNVDKSETFYTGLFHLDTLKTPWPGSRIKWLSLGNGIAFHLIETRKENLTVSKDNHIAFSVPSVDDFIAVLKKQNIPYKDANGKLSSVLTRPDGVKQVYLWDPDGYLIEVNDAP